MIRRRLLDEVFECLEFNSMESRYNAKARRDREVAERHERKDIVVAESLRDSNEVGSYNLRKKVKRRIYKS